MIQACVTVTSRHITKPALFSHESGGARREKRRQFDEYYR